MLETPSNSYFSKLSAKFSDLGTEMANGASFYLMAIFIVLFQFFIDHSGDFVSQFHVLFEVVVRVCCLIVVGAIFMCMDFDDGLTRLQLKVLALIWLMSIIHSGSVGVYPIHTLAILSITVSPALDNLMKRFPETIDASNELANNSQKNS